MPERSMNMVVTYSMYGELNAAILACLVEKPPVAVVVIAWQILSNKGMSPPINNMVSVIVNPK